MHTAFSCFTGFLRECLVWPVRAGRYLKQLKDFQVIPCYAERPQNDLATPEFLNCNQNDVAWRPLQLIASNINERIFLLVTGAVTVVNNLSGHVSFE